MAMDRHECVSAEGTIFLMNFDFKAKHKSSENLNERQGRLECSSTASTQATETLKSRNHDGQDFVQEQRTFCQNINEVKHTDDQNQLKHLANIKNACNSCAHVKFTQVELCVISPPCMFHHGCCTSR
ncbi:hypothetical protein C5167_042661 [Papaver somniferum]|uniref:Uncharacterized protein n=1 Tax=Papaver somniferum TaxID=3469 RepID=A0A4Y7L7D6_PAPSO|nr:hypothetical protein C5167_042661 [Papaver somniferum]